NVPVVACLMDVGASGGYYVALAADRIFAHPTTITGSVGVIAQMVHVHGLFEKIGVSTDTIKSGALKDAGSPFRSLTDEERNLMQGIIDQLYGRFIDTVQARRPGLSPERLEQISTGRVFSASDALENGLIDSVGYLDDALEEAKKLAAIRKAHVVMYRKPFSYRGNIYARVQTLPTQSGDFNLFKMDASNLALLNGRPVFLYLWQP
ncbi:MAG TPA: signal peptide peptidase SppA, partial [bacterium]|nr:signal peptide peptidase SppA [bacterium]